MPVRLDFKVGIIRAGRTQREVSTETKIPEVRLPNIVRGLARPSPAER